MTTRSRSTAPLRAAVLGFALVAPLAAMPQSEPAARMPDQILRDYDSVYMPGSSDGNSPEAIAEFKRQIEAGSRRQAELALELYVVDPAHERMPELLMTRWALMTNALGLADKVIEDTRTILADSDSNALHQEAHRAAAWAALQLGSMEHEERVALVEAAVAANPEHEYCTSYLSMLAIRYTPDPERMRELAGRAQELWHAGTDEYLRTDLRRDLDRIGKSVDCEFVDLATGEPIDLVNEAGRYTVVQMYRWYSDRVHREVAGLAALAKRFPQVRVLTVCIQGVPGSKNIADNALASAMKRGVTWPVHCDANYHLARTLAEMKNERDPWRRFERMRLLLLDADGRLVSFSHLPQTLARHLRTLVEPRQEAVIR